MGAASLAQHATAVTVKGNAHDRAGEKGLEKCCFPTRFQRILFWEADRPKMQEVGYFIGERGGTRTLDPMIKSHVLYHLSYALTCRAV